MFKKFIVALFAIALTITPCANVSAKNVNRYATKTVDLKEHANDQSVTLYKIKQNTKLIVTAQGKTWATVDYNGQVVYVKKAFLHSKKAKNKYPGKKFKKRGRARWNKCSWTWYSQRRFPGKGLKIPGRHLDKKRGFVLDKDGYVCLASGRKNKKKKVVVPTPFGMYGKVYDTNGGNNNKWFDVYVNW